MYFVSKHGYARLYQVANRFALELSPRMLTHVGPPRISTFFAQSVLVERCGDRLWTLGTRR